MVELLAEEQGQFELALLQFHTWKLEGVRELIQDEFSFKRLMPRSLSQTFRICSKGT